MKELPITWKTMHLNVGGIANSPRTDWRNFKRTGGMSDYFWGTETWLH